jgi:predicted Zn-dependent peptidase
VTANDLGFPLHERTLANGLQVVAAPDPSLPVVAVNLWYRVGSRNERPGRTGFAHLFEHMMFQGSAHVPKNGHFELIERAGGSLNATTWFDRTNYFETLPAHQLELALWLESDRMGFMVPAMTQEKLDNQRDVVKNEKRQRYDNQPYGDWDEHLQKLVWPEDHPYHHTVIGSMEDLDAASLDDVAGFFQTYYAPNNAVLTVAGDVEPERAFELVERWFGDLPAGAEPPPVPGRTEVPPTLGEVRRTVLVRDVPLPRALIAYRIPPFTDERFDAADLSAQILGQGRGSRLYRVLVREKRIARDVATYAFPLVTGGSTLLVWITGYPGGDVDRLEAEAADVLCGLVDVSDEEVERARTLAQAREVRGMEHLDHRADLVSMFTALLGDPERLNTMLARIRAVETADVRRFASEFLGADDRAVVAYVPEEAA